MITDPFDAGRPSPPPPAASPAPAIQATAIHLPTTPFWTKALITAALAVSVFINGFIAYVVMRFPTAALTPVVINGHDGKDGRDGINGINGVNGLNGRDCNCPPTPGPNPPLPPPNPGPDPPPVPTPTPTPQGPVRVLILYESSSNLTAAQVNVMNSTKFRAFLTAHCLKDSNVPAFRFWDKDVDTSTEFPAWQAAFSKAKADPAPLPKVVIFAGDAVISAPLPSNEDDAIKLIQKYSG